MRKGEASNRENTDDMVGRQFINDANRLNITVHEILFRNERKGRITALVEREGIPCVMKWNSPDNMRYLVALQREIDFYRKNKECKYLIPLIYEEDHLLLLEYFEGISLYRWIIEYLQRQGKRDVVSVDLEYCVSAILESFSEMHELPLPYTVNEELIKKELKNSFTKFCVSSTKGGPNIRKWEKLFAKLICKMILGPLVAYKLNQVTYDIAAYPMHGDLHLNNIIISSDCHAAKIIDFEEIHIGSALQDLLYLYVFMANLFAKKEAHLVYVRRRFSEFIACKFPDKEDMFFYLTDVMLTGASINRSFGYDVSISKWMWNLLISPLRLLIYNIKTG